MSIIKEDAIGIYVESSGWIARPGGNTSFNVGDNPKTHHFGGSPHHGIGKNPGAKRGEYVEIWYGDGLVHEYGNNQDTVMSLLKDKLKKRIHHVFLLCKAVKYK